MGKKKKNKKRFKEWNYFINRNPNDLSSEDNGDWPVYIYPERRHIVLDVFNKSTGVAHRADYCAFWENYIPILLEKFGKQKKHFYP